MNKSAKALIIIFAVVLGVRLFLAFQAPEFAYEGYFHLRQIEAISSTGLPLYEDPLSYGGRELFFPPLYYYLLALFDLFLPLFYVAKIMPNIFISALVFVVYLLAKKVTEDNEPASLFAAFISGFIPIVFAETVNTVTPLTLVLPLFFLTLYCFFSLSEKKFMCLFVALAVVLSFMHSIFVLFFLAFIAYLLLLKLERMKPPQEEAELFAFSLFFFLWSQFLFYKKAFFAEGAGFLWQNVPQAMFSFYFSRITLGEVLVLLGIIPVLSGAYIAYSTLFSIRRKELLFYLALAFSLVALLWLRLVEPRVVLMFLGVVLTLLFSFAYKLSFRYLEKTKFPKVATIAFAVVFVLFVFNSIYPSLLFASEKETPSREDMAAFFWLRKNAHPDATVLATLEEGHAITHIAHRKNVFDDNFILVKGIDKRFSDVESMFASRYQIAAVDLLSQYEVDYILLTQKGKDAYSIQKLAYLDDKCFRHVYKDGADIFEVKCRVVG